MRTVLVLWLGPLVFFWGWYFLSLADLGGVFFSRALNEEVFAVYGNLLGIDPAVIPMMVAKALVVDSLLLGLIVAFRRRRQIAAWWHGRRAVTDNDTAHEDRSAESLSSAP